MDETINDYPRTCMYSTYSCLGSSAAPIVRGREWESSVRYGKGMTLLSGAILTCYTHLLRLYTTRPLID